MLSLSRSVSISSIVLVYDDTDTGGRRRREKACAFSPIISTAQPTIRYEVQRKID